MHESGELTWRLNASGRVRNGGVFECGCVVLWNYGQVSTFRLSARIEVEAHALFGAIIRSAVRFLRKAVGLGIWERRGQRKRLRNADGNVPLIWFCDELSLHRKG